jgi:hypothetical protein
MIARFYLEKELLGQKVAQKYIENSFGFKSVKIEGVNLTVLLDFFVKTV